MPAVKKHGLSCSPDGRHSPEWRSWYDMIRRTVDPKCPNWKSYGARGIRVCDWWDKDNPDGFVNFLNDMGLKPTRNHRIDRIDNNGHYTPRNCRWSTHKENCRNTRKNRLLTSNGETHCISEWYEMLGGGGREVISSRLASGWSINRAVREPIHRQSKR